MLRIYYVQYSLYFHSTSWSIDYSGAKMVSIGAKKMKIDHHKKKNLFLKSKFENIVTEGKFPLPQFSFLVK